MLQAMGEPLKSYKQGGDKIYSREVPLKDRFERERQGNHCRGSVNDRGETAEQWNVKG